MDARALASWLAALPIGPALRAGVVALARETLERGPGTVAARLSATPGAGHQAAAGFAYLTDAIVRLLHGAATTRLTPAAHRTAGERVSLVAVGGYGRAEMAPQSDVDLAFLLPGKPTGWTEGVVETVLYGLWDLGLRTRDALDVVWRAKAAAGQNQCRMGTKSRRVDAGLRHALRRGQA